MATGTIHPTTESFQLTNYVQFNSIAVNQGRKIGDVCIINFTGVIKNAASATWLPIVVVPSAYAPSGEVMATCIVSDAVAMCSLLEVSGQHVITISPKNGANAKVAITLVYTI